MDRKLFEDDDNLYSQRLFSDEDDDLRDTTTDTFADLLAGGNLLVTGNGEVNTQQILPDSTGGVGILTGSELEMSPSFLDHAFSSDLKVTNSMELLSPTTAAGELAYLNANAGADYSPYILIQDQGDLNKMLAEVDPMPLSEYGIPDEEIISLENWTGNYNFKATPLADEDPKNTKKAKIVYVERSQKLFCDTSKQVPFKFEVDYEKIEDRSQLMIRAFLVYEENDVANRAVLRCAKDLMAEEKLTEGKNIMRLNHLLRAANPSSNMTYYQNPQSKRCYILFPVKNADPGATYFKDMFTFTCRNSCSGADVDGKSRKLISLIFCLYNVQTGEILGRSRTHVRVCSAPLRDYKKELETEMESGAPKRKRMSNEMESESLPSPKHVNLGKSELQMSNGNDYPVQHREAAATVVRSVVLASVKSDDDVSSSQETVYSYTEEQNRIHLRKLIKDIRWTLKQKDSPNPLLRDYSSHVFNSLKVTQNLCQTARSIGKQEDNAENPSPDGGFHDVALEENL